MSEKEVTRRSFLTRASAIGLAVGSGAFLAACGGGDGGSDMAEPQAMEPEAPAAAADQCNDVTGLTEAEVQMRQTLAYVDASPHADKLCSNCQLYIPAAEGASCGGCQIIKGPIAPGGYCTSWAAKVS